MTETKLWKRSLSSLEIICVSLTDSQVINEENKEFDVLNDEYQGALEI